MFGNLKKFSGNVELIGGPPRAVAQPWHKVLFSGNVELIGGPPRAVAQPWHKVLGSYKPLS